MRLAGAASASADHSVSSRIASTSTARNVRRLQSAVPPRAACPRPGPSPCRRAGAGPGSRWPASPPKMSSGVGSSLCTRCAERKISWSSPREVTSPSAPRDFSRPTKSGTTSAGRPRCHAEAEAGRNGYRLLGRDGRTRAALSARLLNSETLGAIVSGLIKEASFYTVRFFTTGQGQETWGTTGKEVVACRVPGTALRRRGRPSEF